MLQKSICSYAITSRSLQPALTYTSHLGAGLNTNTVPRLAEGRGNLQVCSVAGWVNRINHQPWCCFFLEMHFICFIFRCFSQRSLCRCSRRLAMAEEALNSFAWTYYKLHNNNITGTKVTAERKAENETEERTATLTMRSCIFVNSDKQCSSNSKGSWVWLPVNAMICILIKCIQYARGSQSSLDQGPF